MMALNATFGNAVSMGPRRISLYVANGVHVRIGTHVDGIRDPQHPCAEFSLGEPGGKCQSDGHYVCKECVEFDGGVVK